MKVLVTGAGGFLGRAVVSKLLEKGYAVRAIVRAPDSHSQFPEEVELHFADLRVPSQLRGAFDGIGGVVHLAARVSGSEDAQFASTVVGTEKLLDEMAQHEITCFVHVSSIAVYDWGNVSRTLTENSSLAIDYSNMDAYSIAKFCQERVVRERAEKNSWPTVVLRPGFIWGVGHAKIAGMGRTFGRVHIMFGPFTRLPLTHVENCADCIAMALEHKSKHCIEIFNVVDSDDVRVWQYCRTYFQNSGKWRLLVPVPYYAGLALTKLAGFTSRILFGEMGKLPGLLITSRYQAQFKPVRFPTQKLKNELSWAPPYSFKQCVEKTFKKQGQR